MCQPHWSKCPVKKANRRSKMKKWRDDPEYQERCSDSLKKAAQRIDPETGRSKGQTASLNSLKSRQKNICPITGLPMTRIAGIKSVQTKRDTIDPITGLNGIKTATIKATKSRIAVNKDSGLSPAQIGGKRSGRTRQTTLLDSGLTIAQQNARNATQTMKNDIDDYGVSMLKRKALKTIHTLATSIDPVTGKTLQQLRTEKTQQTMLKEMNGITEYERVAISSRTMHEYPNSSIYYQGSYEFKFLKAFEEKYGLDGLIDRIQRGPTIHYFDPSKSKIRIFRPDFLIDLNHIVEVKSSYIMKKAGGTKTLMAKLQACRDQGFSIELILDHVSFLNSDIDVLLSYEEPNLGGDQTPHGSEPRKDTQY